MSRLFRRPSLLILDFLHSFFRCSFSSATPPKHEDNRTVSQVELILIASFGDTCSGYSVLFACITFSWRYVLRHVRFLHSSAILSAAAGY